MSIEPSVTDLPRTAFARRSGASVLAKAALLASSTLSTLALAAEPDFAAIGAYVEAQRIAEHVPGMAVAIVGGDGTVYLAGFGTADVAGRPVASNTPFILGSTSKSFTALAVMQLVEAGRVDLDAPVQRYLPWFRVADEKASAAITVRQLLNQTSGLSTSAGRRTLTDFSSGDEALENRVRGLRDVALTAPVGTMYQYSNCNYQVLGLIIEKVSGQSYGAYMAEHVFAPLAMNRTYTAKPQAVENGLAMGHRMWFGHAAAFDEPFPRASVPQGFIISTAQDMSHYLVAQLNGGRYRDATVLSPDGIAELHRGVAHEGNGDIRYAMGWNAGTVHGETAVWHEGDTFGYQSFMVLLTDARWGAVVLSNANDIPATGRFEEIAFGVAGMLVGKSPETEHVHDSDLTHAFFVGMVALQLIGMGRTVALLRRWRRDPATRPEGTLANVFRVALPSVVNLLWGVVILVGLPAAFASIRTLTWALPDIAYLLLASAVIALAWSAIRAALAYPLVRRRPRPTTN